MREKAGKKFCRPKSRPRPPSRWKDNLSLLSETPDHISGFQKRQGIVGYPGRTSAEGQKTAPDQVILLICDKHIVGEIHVNAEVLLTGAEPIEFISHGDGQVGGGYHPSTLRVRAAGQCVEERLGEGAMSPGAILARKFVLLRRGQDGDIVRVERVAKHARIQDGRLAAGANRAGMTGVEKQQDPAALR